MLIGIYSILTIFIMIGIGFYLTKRKWFNESTAELFSKIVMRVAVPALAIVNIRGRFSKSMLLDSYKFVLIAFGCILIMFLISVVISKILKLEGKKKIIFRLLFTFSNTVFIGLPVNKTIFGEDSILFVLLFFMANNFTFWTLGIYTLANANKEGEKVSIVKNLKRAFTPGLIAIIIAYILVFNDLYLPGFLMDSLQYISNLCIPLSMLFIGINMGCINIKEANLDKKGYIIILGRFLIGPLVMIGILGTLDITGLARNVFIVEAALPVQAQTAIAAKYYDVESEYASILVSVTTLISIFIVPILATIL